MPNCGMQAKNERGPSGGRSPNNHDRAESQVRHQGDWQAPIRDLAGQGPGRTGVRTAAHYHQEAAQHARGCTETAAGLTLCSDLDSQGLGLHDPGLLQSCIHIHLDTAPQVHIPFPTALLAVLDLLHGPDGEVLRPRCKFEAQLILDAGSQPQG